MRTKFHEQWRAIFLYGEIEIVVVQDQNAAFEGGADAWRLPGPVFFLIPIIWGILVKTAQRQPVRGHWPSGKEWGSWRDDDSGGDDDTTRKANKRKKEKEKEKTQPRPPRGTGDHERGPSTRPTSGPTEGRRGPPKEF